MNTGYQVRGLRFQVYCFNSALSAFLSYFFGVLVPWRFPVAGFKLQIFLRASRQRLAPRPLISSFRFSLSDFRFLFKVPAHSLKPLFYLCFICENLWLRFPLSAFRFSPEVSP